MEWKLNLIEEFDVDVWAEDGWFLKRSFPKCNPPENFSRIAPYNRIVLYDFDRKIFIDGNEENEDVFQLSYFKNFKPNPLMQYLSYCLHKEE